VTAFGGRRGSANSRVIARPLFVVARDEFARQAPLRFAVDGVRVESTSNRCVQSEAHTSAQLSVFFGFDGEASKKPRDENRRIWRTGFEAASSRRQLRCAE
jgi:hypothetical protein